jgi:hypothetical protein
MPRAEYSRVVRSSFDAIEERRPKSGHAFSAEQVAGWSDGDYPTWRQQKVENVLPTTLLERYGGRCSSVINGSFWMIPPEKSEMIRHLRALGYRIQSRRSLNFH